MHVLTLSKCTAGSLVASWELQYSGVLTRIRILGATLRDATRLLRHRPALTLQELVYRASSQLTGIASPAGVRRLCAPALAWTSGRHRTRSLSRSMSSASLNEPGSFSLDAMQPASRVSRPSARQSEGPCRWLFALESAQQCRRSTSSGRSSRAALLSLPSRASVSILAFKRTMPLRCHPLLPCKDTSAESTGPDIGSASRNRGPEADADASK